MSAREKQTPTEHLGPDKNTEHMSRHLLVAQRIVDRDTETVCLPEALALSKQNGNAEHLRISRPPHCLQNLHPVMHFQSWALRLHSVMHF